jgi:hypothetical protein
MWITPTVCKERRSIPGSEGRLAKKIELIERTNPSWSDLSEAWRAATADPSTALRSGRDDKGGVVTFRKEGGSDRKV